MAIYRDERGGLQGAKTKYRGVLTSADKRDAVCETCEGAGQIDAVNTQGLAVMHVTCPTCSGSGAC